MKRGIGIVFGILFCLVVNVSFIFAEAAPDVAGIYKFTKYSDTMMGSGSFAIDVYYPNSTGPSSAVIFAPGYGGSKEEYKYIGEHLSSHGFVVIIFSVPNRFTFETTERVEGFGLAINYLTSKNSVAGTLYNKVNVSKIGIGGHSLGGGSALVFLSQDARAKAFFALAPYCDSDSSNSVESVTVPVQMQVGTNDGLTTPSSVSKCYSYLQTNNKEYLEVNGGNHLQYASELADVFKGSDGKATITRAQQQKIAKRYFTSWMYYYLNSNTAYEKYLFGANAQADLSSGNLTKLIYNYSQVSECTNGQTRSCGTNVGNCETGIETCVNSIWDVCTGSVGPITEICDSLDNNCDEVVDEDCNVGNQTPCTNCSGNPSKPGPFRIGQYEDTFDNSYGKYKIDVYFPADSNNSTKISSLESTYPAIIFSPGWGANSDYYTWIGKQLASHGFIILLYSIPVQYDVLMNTRIDGFSSSIEYLESKNNDSSHMLYKKINMNNLALSGHSYGGGAAALYLARNDPRVKVGLLVAPYCLTINVSGLIAPNLMTATVVSPEVLRDLAKISVPTEMVISEFDVGESAWTCYSAIKNPPKQAVEINGGTHGNFCDPAGAALANAINQQVPQISLQKQQEISNKYYVSWAYYYLKNNSKYLDYVNGVYGRADLASGVLSRFDNTNGPSSTCSGNECFSGSGSGTTSNYNPTAIINSIKEIIKKYSKTTGRFIEDLFR